MAKMLPKSKKGRFSRIPIFSTLLLLREDLGPIGWAISGVCAGVFHSVAANGENITGKDIIRSATVGGVSGLTGGTAELVAKEGTGSKVVGVTAGILYGAIGGAASAAVIKIVENYLSRAELTSEDLKRVSWMHGMALWQFLCDNGIIVNNVVARKIPSSCRFPRYLQKFEEEVRCLVDVHYKSVLDGVEHAAMEGSLIGVFRALQSIIISNS